MEQNLLNVSTSEEPLLIDVQGIRKRVRNGVVEFITQTSDGRKVSITGFKIWVLDNGSWVRYSAIHPNYLEDDYLESIGIDVSNDSYFGVAEVVKLLINVYGR